jgi:uncharacterized protein (TIGR00251 family)
MKLINVKVIPNAKENEVSEERNRFKVHVTAPAVGGKANRALIEVLAEYFKVKKGDVRIIRGEKSREKIVEIRDT